MYSSYFPAMANNSESNKKNRLNNAQKCKNYRSKLKMRPDNDSCKQKRAAEMRNYRAKKKRDENQLPDKELQSVIANRRGAVRERVRKHRERSKIQKLDEIENKIVKSQTSSLSDLVAESYNCKQTLGKAVKKVTVALPNTPKRKRAVLASMLSNFDDAEKNELLNVMTSPPPKKKQAPNEIDDDIHLFLERDDISRVSPKIKDVKSYVCPKTGNKILLPTRHLVLTLKEVYALFVEERKQEGKDVCGFSHFKSVRPQHVKLINDLPHNMCMCLYHGNFIEAVDSLHKYVPSIPNYANGFVRQFLCECSSIDCWFSKCDKCLGITIAKLKDLVDDKPLQTNVSWMVWKKSSQTKRIEKREENGTLSNLIAHISALSSQFLKHSFTKREQSNTFNVHDRPRASNVEFEDEALLQIDFAENFVCKAQDEVQSAHWNQIQLTLFTTAFYYNEIFQSKVFVSDNLKHTKETIVPYLYKVLSKIPSSVKVLKIWSDGPSSQFKNKYIAAIMPNLEKKFDLKIFWNYFATSHGKGCIDGIGAISKTIVRKHIRARDCIVNSAADFVKAMNRTQSEIIVEEVTNAEFDDINADLNTASVFSNSKEVRDIASAHHIRIVDGKAAIYGTSKQGYE